MASMPRFDPGPHWWEACALNNAPPLLPNSYIFTVSHRLASDLISDSWSLKFPFQGQLRNLSGYFLHALLMIDIKFTMFDFVTVYCILKAWRFTWKDCDGNHGYVKCLFCVDCRWVNDTLLHDCTLYHFSHTFNSQTSRNIFWAVLTQWKQPVCLIQINLLSSVSSFLYSRTSMSDHLS